MTVDLFETDRDEEARLNPPQTLCDWCGEPVYQGNTLQRDGVFSHLHCKRVNKFREWQVDNYSAPLEISLDCYEGTLTLYDVQSRVRIYVSRDAMSCLRDALYEACVEQSNYDAKHADQEGL